MAPGTAGPSSAAACRRDQIVGQQVERRRQAAEGGKGGFAVARLELVQKLPDGATLVPVQTLGALFNLLVRKAGRTKASARSAILSWSDAFTPIETSPAVMLAAADLAVDNQFGIWDAVILAAAATAGCRLLLSEDPARGVHLARRHRDQPVFRLAALAAHGAAGPRPTFSGAEPRRPAPEQAPRAAKTSCWLILEAVLPPAIPQPHRI